MTRCILLGVLIFDGIIDGMWRVIPWKVNVAASAVGILYTLWVNGLHGLGELTAGVLIGMAVLALSIITNGTLGKGDGLLFMMTGCWLGGKENMLLLVWTCFLVGLFAGGLFVLKKVGMRTEIPIAPFVLAVYVGRMIVG